MKLFAALREQAGLDGSLLEQYLAQLGALLTGDLGTSLATGRTVVDMIAGVVPGSLAVAGLALVIGVLTSVVLAFLASIAPWRWLRDLLVQLPPLGVAVPAFVTGLILISVFSFSLGLLPASGSRSGGSVILPAVTPCFFATSEVEQPNARSLAMCRMRRVNVANQAPTSILAAT